MASASAPVSTDSSPSKKSFSRHMEHHDNLFAPDEDNFTESSEDELDDEELEMENLNQKVTH